VNGLAISSFVNVPEAAGPESSPLSVPLDMHPVFLACLPGPTERVWVTEARFKFKSSLIDSLALPCLKKQATAQNFPHTMWVYSNIEQLLLQSRAQQNRYVGQRTCSLALSHVRSQNMHVDRYPDMQLTVPIREPSQAQPSAYIESKYPRYQDTCQLLSNPLIVAK
jgi:hypothetical protein